MHVGLALSQFDLSVAGASLLPWQTVQDRARQAEDMGFESLWVTDHVLAGTRSAGRPAHQEAHDPLVALGALARVTHRVRLGTLMLSARLRPTAVLAKALATVDVVSGGRLVVGLGAGCGEDEIFAAGPPMEQPADGVAHLAEACQVLVGMFGGGPFSFAGAHVEVTGARCLPLPVQRPHPPIWVGGRGDRLLDVVARHADGWNVSWASTPDAYRESVAVLEAACDRVGRDPATVTRSLGLSALVGEDEADLRRRFRHVCELAPPAAVPLGHGAGIPFGHGAGIPFGHGAGIPFGAGPTLDEWREGRLVGTLDEVGRQLEEWEALGVDTLVLGGGPVPFFLSAPDDVAMLASACNLEAV